MKRDSKLYIEYVIKPIDFAINEFKHKYYNYYNYEYYFNKLDQLLIDKYIELEKILKEELD